MKMSEVEEGKTILRSQYAENRRIIFSKTLRKKWDAFDHCK